MENQVKANTTRISVLEDQNEGLRRTITKMVSKGLNPSTPPTNNTTVAHTHISTQIVPPPQTHVRRLLFIYFLFFPLPLGFFFFLFFFCFCIFFLLFAFFLFIYFFFFFALGVEEIENKSEMDYFLDRVGPQPGKISWIRAVLNFECAIMVI